MKDTPKMLHTKVINDGGTCWEWHKKFKPPVHIFGGLELEGLTILAQRNFTKTLT